MEELLMTEKEKKRKKQHKEICKKFVYLCEKYPQYKPYRIFGSIATEYNMTATGVARICCKEGYYQPTTRNCEQHDTGTTESEQHGALQRQ